MSDDFYRAFEERYRGSRELIKTRLRVYLPFIEPLLSLYKDAQAIDLGCGRGEWLELLKESGFDGHGVDLDEGMLAACRDRGLSVTTEDALSALKALPDESQVLVSGFHIAEHLSFSDLQLLVQEVLRVLKPAGLLILETPNPENIIVGTASFYLDPTHQRPIPPLLLSFLPEHYGYAKVKVLRLQEDKSLAEKVQTSLSDVLGGVSPDYAVVAQKYANDALLICNSVAFEHEYGLTLGALTGKFDQQVQQTSERATSAEAQAQQASARAAIAEAETRVAQAEAQTQQASARAAIAEAETRIAQVEAQAQLASARAAIAEAETRTAQAEAQTQQASARAAIAEAETRIAQAEAQAQQASARAAIAEAETRVAQAEAQTQQASARAAELDAKLETTGQELHNVHQANHHHWQLAATRHQQIEALQDSTSWRVTAPLRWVGALVRDPTPKALKLRAKVLLQHAALYVGRRPHLKNAALKVLHRFPNIKTRLAQTIRQTTIQPSQPQSAQSPDLQADVTHLTPHARQIYADLKAAIERRQKERS